MAEELIAPMKREHVERANDAKTILIGITRSGMYTREKPEWRFPFACGELPHFAVISSARMDPVNLGGGPNQSVLDQRQRKMVSKYIGYMYFKLPPSSDPRSVMYTPILGLEELDGGGEDF